MKDNYDLSDNELKKRGWKQRGRFLVAPQEETDDDESFSKKIGSIAYKIALVAKGEIDLALSFSKKNDWDLAAADLIIKEAGGNLKDINGNEIFYNKSSTQINSVLAGNSFIINNLTNLLNK